MKKEFLPITCIVCQKEFIPKSKKHRCCCVECGKKHSLEEHRLRWARNAPQRVKKEKCRTCGTEYIKTGVNLYCSDNCRTEYRNNYAKNLNHIKNPPCTNCQYCGKEIVNRKHVKYCSDECFKKYRRKKYGRKRKVFEEKNCLVCNNKFIPKIGKQVTCENKECKRILKNIKAVEYRKTEQHKQNVKNYAATEHGRLKILNMTMKRYALKLKTKVEEIDYNWINERDGFKCQICGKKVNMKLKYPDQMSKSYDHIVPLSIGGVHCNYNLQLTHLVCNIKKKANIKKGVQLNLF